MTGPRLPCELPWQNEDLSLGFLVPNLDFCTVSAGFHGLIVVEQ